MFKAQEHARRQGRIHDRSMNVLFEDCEVEFKSTAIACSKNGNCKFDFDTIWLFDAGRMLKVK